MILKPFRFEVKSGCILIVRFSDIIVQNVARAGCCCTCHAETAPIYTDLFCLGGWEIQNTRAQAVCDVFFLFSTLVQNVNAQIVNKRLGFSCEPRCMYMF